MKNGSKIEICIVIEFAWRTWSAHCQTLSSDSVDLIELIISFSISYRWRNRFGKVSKPCMIIISWWYHYTICDSLEFGHFTTKIFPVRFPNWASQFRRLSALPKLHKLTVNGRKPFEFLKLPSIAWNIFARSKARCQRSDYNQIY